MLLTTALELLGFSDLQDIDYANFYDEVLKELFTPGLKQPEKNKIFKYGDYLIVTLTKKHVMLVDDCERVREILKKNCFYDSHGYACSRVAGTFHRLLLNTPIELEVDHLNRIRSDNRLENLRCVTHSENTKNISRRIDNNSGITGVRYHTVYDGYHAYIYKDGIQTSKCFSCKKYGRDEAFRLACKWREQRKKELGYLGE